MSDKAEKTRRQLPKEQSLLAATQQAVEGLWGYYDGNSLRAMPGFEDDIREAWNKLLTAVGAAAAFYPREAERLRQQLAKIKAKRDYWRGECKRHSERLTELGAAEAAVTNCGLTGIYDDFSSPANAIKQMVERLVHLEGGQALQAERQLRQEAERRAERAEALVALAESTYVQVPALLQGPMLRMIDEARTLALRIREALEANDAN